MSTTAAKVAKIAVPMARAEAEDFLYREASLLDAWRLEEWLDLFTLDCVYEIPAPDLPEADPGQTFSLIHDNRSTLEQRVIRLKKPTAHAEYPHSRTRRIITNVQVEDTEDGPVVHSNFTVHRFRPSSHLEFVGGYRHLLVRDGDGFKIRRRRAVLDHYELSPHGKVSIIL